MSSSVVHVTRVESFVCLLHVAKLIIKLTLTLRVKFKCYVAMVSVSEDFTGPITPHSLTPLEGSHLDKQRRREISLSRDGQEGNR